MEGTMKWVSFQMFLKTIEYYVMLQSSHEDTEMNGDDSTAGTSDR